MSASNQPASLQPDLGVSAQNVKQLFDNAVKNGVGFVEVSRAKPFQPVLSVEVTDFVGVSSQAVISPDGGLQTRAREAHTTKQS